MNTSIYAAVMPENSRCMRFMAWGYITIPITVKRLYGLVFACYGKDTESKQPKPIVVNFDNEEKVEARENDDAGAKQGQARKEHYYTGEQKRFYFTDKRFCGYIVDTKSLLAYS